MIIYHIDTNNQIAAVQTSAQTNFFVPPKNTRAVELDFIIEGPVSDWYYDNERMILKPSMPLTVNTLLISAADPESEVELVVPIYTKIVITAPGYRYQTLVEPDLSGPKYSPIPLTDTVYFATDIPGEYLFTLTNMNYQTKTLTVKVT